MSAQHDECPTECVCDRRGSMIDNLYRKRVSEKNAANCSKIVQILHAYNFRNLNIRFASLTRRAFVAGAPNQFAPWSREAGMCLLDTQRNMCPPMVFVGHGINKCLRRYAPGMYECLRDNI